MTVLPVTWLLRFTLDALYMSVPTLSGSSSVCEESFPEE